jgi:CRP/FNR family transcriptional regulator, cyclic AMP receptor protein
MDIRTEVPSAPAGWPSRSFLGSLPDAALAAVLSLGTRRTVPANSSLVVAGDFCTDVVVLIDGWAKVVAVAGEHGQPMLALRFGGDLIGEQAAFENEPRTVTVVTAGPALVGVIGRGQFLRCLMDWPEAGIALSRSLSAKWAPDRRIDLGGLPVLARLSRVLAELAERHGGPWHGRVEFGCPLTHPELAAMIGASEQSVHKALRQLRAEGAIETGHRKIMIVDGLALAASGCQRSAMI